MLLLLLACHLSPPTCPDGFVQLDGVGGPYCIQPYEVRFEGQLGRKNQGFQWPDGSTQPTALRSEPGLSPTMNLSWYQAASACKAMGWRLCSSTEWEDACDGRPGPGGATHPTPDGSLAPLQCAIMDFQHTRAPYPTGSHDACRTPTGLYDLEGNLWEWTDPQQVGSDGKPLIDKRGGGWYSGAEAPCSKAAVGTHPPEFDGTIGFRCCTDPR